MTSPIDLKKAMNTFNVFFEHKPKKIILIENALSYVLVSKLGSEVSLKRKINMLTLSTTNDPFFEYFGYVRQLQTIKGD